GAWFGAGGKDRALLGGKGRRPPSAETQHAQAALAADQGQEAVGLQTLSSDQTTELGRVGAVHDYRLSRLQGLPGERALERHQEILLDAALAVREVEGVDAQLVVLRLQQLHARYITVHH